MNRNTVNGFEIQTRKFKIQFSSSKKEYELSIIDKRNNIDPIIFSAKISKVTINIFGTLITGLLGWNYFR